MIALVSVIHDVQLREYFGLFGNGAAWMAGKNPAMMDTYLSERGRPARGDRAILRLRPPGVPLPF